MRPALLELQRWAVFAHHVNSCKKYPNTLDPFFPPCVSLKLDGRADGAVDSREKLVEFCFDYCYWSVDPAHPHYASQEEVTAARVSFDDEAQTLVSRDLRLPVECFLLTSRCKTCVFSRCHVSLL